MAGILPDVFSLDHISQDDIFVASAGDELGVVFADVEGVDVVIMNVFVVFYHDVSWGVVETHAAILGSSHAVLAVSVELYGVDGACVYFCERFEGGWEAVFYLPHGNLL